MPRLLKLSGLALLLAVGCSGPDPGDGRLADGSYATIHAGKDESAFSELDGGNVGMIPAGTRVMIVSDGSPDRPGGHRPVRVSVREGKYQGRSASIDRVYLRPAR